MKEDVKQKWIGALRSGTYKQGQSRLRKGDAYCCLGVLCDLYHKETGKGAWVLLDSSNGEHKFDDGLEPSGGVLPFRVREWAGLGHPDPYIGRRVRRATAYNDGLGDDMKMHSFNEIADQIEQYVE